MRCISIWRTSSTPGPRPGGRRRTGFASVSIRPFKTSFTRPAFRRKLYHSLEELQADVDVWMEGYNAERTHTGKYCYGKTPLQTFIESAMLAYDKQLDRIELTSEPATAAA